MPEKYKYPPNYPFLERRHSKVFRKMHGYFSHTAYAYHKLHPKTHFAITPKYGDTTCVRLLHSVSTYRGPTCRGAPSGVLECPGQF
ncbi:hypothetical protein AB205_0041560 [Aquarana catesbeiana]|uniref:Uncharacterized protein n=1 Tax=Aquarana catesbeiana TaxID=8400 RepID=A0A2G9Q3R3_AQUCT|nr:hypothetical protein AB205_0041560 [Aquarana catesbeiana]